MQCCGESPEKGETEALHRHERNQRTETNGGGDHNNRYRHKMSTESELRKHLDEGWDLVKELSNGKLVVRGEDYLFWSIILNQFVSQGISFVVENAHISL